MDATLLLKRKKKITRNMVIRVGPNYFNYTYGYFLELHVNAVSETMHSAIVYHIT